MQKTYIKNMPELRRFFKQLDKLTQRSVMETAVKAGLLTIANEIVRKAPRLTGTYARSWQAATAIEMINGSYRVTGELGTDVKYGPRLEFGYMATDSLGRQYHQTAKPHVRPAFDAKQDEAIAEMKAALLILINSL